jgi:LacI family transcriptional regulator
VFFDRICSGTEYRRVITKDEGGAFIATEHLINIGCKKVAHFAAPQNFLIGQGAGGVSGALKQYKLNYDPNLVALRHNGTSRRKNN